MYSTKSTNRYIHSTKAATVLPVYRHHRPCWQFARSDIASFPRHLNVRKCGLSNNIYTPLHTPGSSTDSLVINITHPHLVILHNEKQWSRKGGDKVGYAPLMTRDTKWTRVVRVTPQPFHPREGMEQKAGWAPEGVWLFCRRQKSLVRGGIRTPDLPAHRTLCC